jgi:hypothetical protein
MITSSKQITKHFHSTEFRCKCGCGRIKIDERLVNNMEKVFSKLNASKCIISSGYRCDSYDKKIGGFVGQHAKGYAADCIYYDKNNKPIPSKYVICAAYDSDLFRGIAKINDNYTHLDIRTSGYYKGDETVSNNSVWSDPYTYFKVTKEDMAKYTGEVIKPALKYKVGDTVNINGVFVSSTSDKKLKPAKTKGKITKLVSGARNPYLLENGNIGWTNDSCIVSKVTPAVYKTISNCTWLNLRTSPMYGSNIYKSVKAGTKVEYLGVSNGWARIKYNNKVLYCGTGYLK